MGKAKGGGLNPATTLRVELNGATLRKIHEGHTFETIVDWARERAGNDAPALNDEAQAHVAAWLHTGEPRKLLAAAILATAAGADIELFPGEQVLEIYRRSQTMHSAPGPGR